MRAIVNRFNSGAAAPATVFDAGPVAPLPATDEVAVAAIEVSKRYGEGDSAVDAVRGVTLEVPAGQFTAIMGPRARASRR